MSDLTFGDPRLANAYREPELPWWMRRSRGIKRVPLSSDFLPSEAAFRSWRLERVIGMDAYDERETIILYDKEGSILHEWPVGYWPSLGNIEDMCQNLIKGAADGKFS